MRHDVDNRVERIAGDGARELPEIAWTVCHAVMSQCSALARKR